MPCCPAILVLLSSALAQERVRVELVDGQVLNGQLNEADRAAFDQGQPLLLRVDGSGEPLVVPPSAIAGLEHVELSRRGFSVESPSSNRYFYAPTAFPVGKGQGYVSQKELIATTAAYGLTEHIGVSGGTALPLLLSRDFLTNVGVPLEVGAKGSVRAADRVHLGAGAELIGAIGQGGGGALLAFGTVTVGDYDSSLSLVGGSAWVIGDTGDREMAFPAVLAGMHRMGPRWALVSENWTVTVPSQASVAMAFAEGVRFLPDDEARWSIDTALIEGVMYDARWAGSRFEATPFPIPWIDFSWYFGG